MNEDFKNNLRECVNKNNNLSIDLLSKVLGSAVIIIVDKDKFMIGRRADNNRWGFAGGKTEKNELPVFTAQRELQEEFGLFFPLERFQYAGSSFAYKDPTKKASTEGVGVNFIIDCTYDEVKDFKLKKNEVTEIEFPVLEELKNYDWYIDSVSTMALFFNTLLGSVEDLC